MSLIFLENLLRREQFLCPDIKCPKQCSRIERSVEGKEIQKLVEVWRG